MHLAIVSHDPFQTRVLTGAASRRGWQVDHFCSSDGLAACGLHFDAVVLDVEDVDRRARREIACLASRVGQHRLVLLAETIRCADSVPLPVQGVQFKPFRPSRLLDFVQMSVSPKHAAANERARVVSSATRA